MTPARWTLAVIHADLSKNVRLPRPSAETASGVSGSLIPGQQHTAHSNLSKCYQSCSCLNGQSAIHVCKPESDLASIWTHPAVKRPSVLTFESERQRFLGLKVLNIAQRIAVNVAAGFAAHLEHGWEIQLNSWVLG